MADNFLFYSGPGFKITKWRSVFNNPSKFEKKFTYRAYNTLGVQYSTRFLFARLIYRWIISLCILLHPPPCRLNPKKRERKKKKWNVNELKFTLSTTSDLANTRSSKGFTTGSSLLHDTRYGAWIRKTVRFKRYRPARSWRSDKSSACVPSHAYGGHAKIQY